MEFGFQAGAIRSVLHIPSHLWQIVSSNAR
jgi:hypothetical protein